MYDVPAPRVPYLCLMPSPLDFPFPWVSLKILLGPVANAEIIFPFDLCLFFSFLNGSYGMLWRLNCTFTSSLYIRAIHQSRIIHFSFHTHTHTHQDHNKIIISTTVPVSFNSYMSLNLQSSGNQNKEILSGLQMLFSLMFPIQKSVHSGFPWVYSDFDVLHNLWP